MAEISCTCTYSDVLFFSCCCNSFGPQGLAGVPGIMGLQGYPVSFQVVIIVANMFSLCAKLMYMYKLQCNFPQRDWSGKLLCWDAVCQYYQKNGTSQVCLVSSNTGSKQYGRRSSQFLNFSKLFT